MTHKTQMTSDLSVFFNTDEYAETVAYTPTGGVQTNITAVVIKDAALLEPYVRGEATAICEIVVQTSEVATPQHGDIFTFGGETWEFDPSNGVVYEDDDILKIALERRME